MWKWNDGLISCILLVLLVVPAPPTTAGAPPVNPVFTRQLAGGYVSHSSPTLADLDNDGTLEIIVGSLENCTSVTCPDQPHRWNEDGYPSYLSVVNSDGTIRWERQVAGSINSTPAVGDIDGDGQPEIVVGLGAENWPLTDGGVVAYEANGDWKWTADTMDRGSGSGPPDGRPDAVWASPSIADVNNDGINEVIFGGWDFRMHVVSGVTGEPIANWSSPESEDGPVYDGLEMLDSIWSSPAVTDLNGDGFLDFVFGGDISKHEPAGTQDGGLLRAMQYDGTHLPGEFSKQFGNICTVAPCPTDIGHYGVYEDQAFYSSPAIGDLDNDGDYEIVIGSGRPFSAGTLGHWVKVYDHQGNLLRTLDTDGLVFGSPALADLDGDGYLDIVAGTEILDNNAALAGRGTMYAWSGQDYSLLWHTDPAIIIGHVDVMPITSSPVVADIDPTHFGPEVLFGLGPEICVLNAWGEQLTADNVNSSKPTLWIGRAPVSNSPAVADIDNDGNLEIVAAGEHYAIDNQVLNYRGWVVAWRWPGAEGNAADAYLPWPMFRRDARHTARYPSLPRLSVAPISLYIAHQYGDTSDEQTTLQIHNTGDESFTWSATAPPGITLFPSSGTVATQTLVSVTIATTGYSAGTHDLGNIDITGTANGGPVAGSPVSVPVTLYVGEVHKIFLPFTLKSGGS